MQKLINILLQEDQADEVVEAQVLINVRTYQIMLQLTTLQNQQNLQIILTILILLKFVLSNVNQVMLEMRKMQNVKNQMLKLQHEIQLN
jgi:succinate-acetate transporter protein